MSVNFYTQNFNEIEDVKKISRQFLSEDYKDTDCLKLASMIYQEGLGIKCGYNVFESSKRFHTIWQKDFSEGRPIDVVGPWDLITFKINRPWVTHIGVALDQAEFIHTGPHTGVTNAPFLRWEQYIFQVCRPQLLLSSNDLDGVQRNDHIDYSSEYVNVHFVESVLPRPDFSLSHNIEHKLPGRYIENYIPEKYRDKLKIVLNRKEIDREFWDKLITNPGDQLCMYSTVGIPAAAVPFILLAVGTGLQIALQYAFRPKPASLEDNPASSTISGAQSRIRGGTPVPLAYGIRRLGIQYVSQSVNYSASYIDDGSPPPGVVIGAITGGTGNVDSNAGPNPSAPRRDDGPESETEGE